MGFVESIKTCFSKYFVFSGRATRSEFWYFLLFLVIGDILTIFVDFSLNPELLEIETEWYDIGPTGVLGTIFLFATWIPLLSVAIRRLHDVNRSGWWWLIPITIIGIIPFAYWLLKQSDTNSNKYGPKPVK